MRIVFSMTTSTVLLTAESPSSVEIGNSCVRDGSSCIVWGEGRTYFVTRPMRTIEKVEMYYCTYIVLNIRIVPIGTCSRKMLLINA